MALIQIVPGFETWSELDLLTGLLIGEAAGEPTAGKIGVAVTVKSRVEEPKWWGRNWREVILCYRPAAKPGENDIAQFSCWLDHNRKRIIEARKSNNSLWGFCRSIAVDAYLGLIQDHIGRPTHYHADYVRPKWANSLERLAQIGRHIFYR